MLYTNYYMVMMVMKICVEYIPWHGNILYDICGLYGIHIILY